MNAQSTSAASLALPTAEPLSSLAALRRRHSVLLRANQSESEVERPSLEELIQFLAQIKATGRNLAAEQSRETAENLLDYWGSVVLAKQPDAFSTFVFLELDPYYPSASAEEAQGDKSEQESAARANARLRQTAEELEKSLAHKAREALRLVLIRLISMGPNSPDISLAPLPVRDPLLQTAGPKQIIGRLEAAAIVRTEGEGTSLSYVLANPALLVEWPLLKQLCNDRKSLREIANGWDKAGRTKAALLNRSAQLQQAADFKNLNPIEQEFLEESRKRAEQIIRLATGAVFVAFLIGAAVLLAAYFKVHAQRDDAMNAKNELARTNAVLSQTLADVSEALAATQSALGQLTNLQHELIVAHEENDKLRQENQLFMNEIKRLNPKTTMQPAKVEPPEKRLKAMQGATNSIKTLEKDVSTLSHKYPPAVVRPPGRPKL